ncbi:MAG: hypothetical protein LC737_02580 [Chloroflexi bacterium]|nr:hypothetical protein [Chloroflexota bacterium]
MLATIVHRSTRLYRRWMTWLVAWYGLYQAVHVGVNALYLLNPNLQLFPPPTEGWSPQAAQFLNGLAVIGLLNALMALGFVYGYFTKRHWAVWLGTVTLTVSLCLLAVFTYGTLASGAWIGNTLAYLWLYVPVVPIALLFVAWSAFVSPLSMAD